MPLITLLTDFGTADYFVGALKGAILSVCPEAQVVDLTHDIPPHDIEAGAFTLAAAAETFPAGTIHVAVVDPGVGSARRPLLLLSNGHLFVGPDNGLFGHLYERDRGCRVYHLTNTEYFRDEVSATFQGRDLFAPVAGALARGVSPETLGVLISDPVRHAPSEPVRLEDGTLEASIIHLDRFGNCITNITPSDLTEAEIAGGARLIIGGREISSFRRFFAEGAGAPGELMAVWGSAGFLEIAADCDSAARLLGARRGQTVRVRSSKRKVQS
jgi:S-adenosylmethionine hydrolase